MSYEGGVETSIMEEGRFVVSPRYLYLMWYFVIALWYNYIHVISKLIIRPTSVDLVIIFNNSWTQLARFSHRVFLLCFHTMSQPE